MRNISYDRRKAIDYAHRWAFKRNPKFYDFSELGGDCTNFISQILYAGSGVMNHTKLYGWYYNSINDRTPSWSGVEFLYNFLTGNKGVGPYGYKVNINNIEIGDIIQLKFNNPNFEHSLAVVATGSPSSVYNTLIATHTMDSDYRPVYTYSYSDIRFIHIAGVRTW